MPPSRRVDDATPLSEPPHWSAVLEDGRVEHATLQELFELVSRGRITPDTPVRKEGMGDFFEAKKFPELRASLLDRAEPTKDSPADAGRRDPEA